MTNRTGIAAAALAALATSLATAVPAQAEDQRPCISKVEFTGGVLLKGGTRDYVEERFEVQGLGRHRVSPMFGDVILYPRCGYARSEAYYAIKFYKGWTDLSFGGKSPDATLHGQP